MSKLINCLSSINLIPEKISLGRNFGLARSLLALSTFLTIAFNKQETLFPTIKGRHFYINNEGIFPIPTLFELCGAEHFLVAKLCSLFILGLVIIGYRPRITSLFHWWVAFSFNTTVFITEGGDQIACVLSMLLLPLSVIDSRKWHWQKIEFNKRWPRFLANLSISAIRIQVCLVYAHACIGKFSSPEWTDGTALYYWFNNSFIGASEPFLAIMNVVFKSGTALTFASWSVLALEFALAAALLAKNKYKPLIFGLAVTMHTGIIFAHGILAFVIVMYAALIFYLCPPATYRNITAT